jgi:hypothetical protein
VGDLVLRLDEERIDTLLWALDQVVEDPDVEHEKNIGALFDQLRAALDSPPVEEERQEFRVVYDDKLSGLREIRNCFARMTLSDCEELVESGNGLRIQSRPVFTGPWTDLPGEGD